MGVFQDLTGQKFNRLTVLERDFSKNRRVYWLCQCDCGNTVSVAACNLKNGNTKSCGCYQQECRFMNHRKDLTNQRFGKLIALFPTEKRVQGKIVWTCQCDCGKFTEVTSSNLLSGHTSSCGCFHRSLGETKIEQLLQQANIIYEKEKSFNNCIFPTTHRKARFDFFIPSENYLIEFDGRQHFYACENDGWNTSELVQFNQTRDAYKNQWCKDNGIPLIRIPYTHLNKLCLKDLLLGSSKFLV